MLLWIRLSLSDMLKWYVNSINPQTMHGMLWSLPCLSQLLPNVFLVSTFGQSIIKKSGFPSDHFHYFCTLLCVHEVMSSNLGLDVMFTIAFFQRSHGIIAWATVSCSERCSQKTACCSVKRNYVHKVSPLAFKQFNYWKYCTHDIS